MDVVSQFIDVITTFKCKACPFICYKQEDLVNHVKAKHLPSQHSNSSQPDLDSSRTDCLEDVAEANSTNTLMTLVDDSSASIDGQYMQGSGLQPISIQTYVNDATTEQVVLVDTASGRSAGEIFPQTEPQQELFLCGQCNMGFQVGLFYSCNTS
ncbi:uncharacterized protein [Watersipora subatra]|uniref:uncharacterized protein n=1 Tax=Watersipora subatra TaxID=2589382 RepID=UPI00355BF480